MASLLYNGYTNPNGAITFTDHLARMLNAKIYRASKNPTRKKPFYIGDKLVTEISFESISLLPKPVLVTQFYDSVFTPDGEFESRAGKYDVVIHSAQENGMKSAEYIQELGGRIIVIRRGTQTRMTEAGISSTLLPHPYIPMNGKPNGNRNGAICISRISSEKKPEIIVEANLLLPQEKQIKILAPITSRVHEYYKLRKMDTNWKRNYLGFETSIQAVYLQLLKRVYTVDMSGFAKLGEDTQGGTQYTFLEAMDAGCTLILNREWLGNNTGQLREGYNCLAADNASELAYVIESGRRIFNMERNIKNTLAVHIGCAQLWEETLRRRK